MLTKLVIIFILLKTSHCAKILGFFPVPSISHQATFQPIWRELALRGHEVTVISPNILNENIENLTEIDVGHSYELVYRQDVAKMFSKENTVLTVLDTMYTFLEEIIINEWENPDVMKLIKGNDTKFDIILVEALVPLAYAWAGKFQVPVVGIWSLGASLNGQDAVGNPSHPVGSPDLFLRLEENPDFLGRIKSVFFNIYFKFIYNTYWVPRYDHVARSYFGENISSVGDLERNVSLMMVNVNPFMHTVRPNVPAVIEISQLHIKKGRKRLPSDIKQFLDSATEGFIYFSLGSNVKSSNLDIGLRQTILEALGNLPFKVLWKWETDHLPGQPKNVKISKWLPQQEVLGHPNIKAFVTQCGIQSIEEALSNGVPMVGMPFMGDQPMNAYKLIKKGVAKYVDFETVTKEELKKVIIEVATSKKYKEKAIEMQSLLSDVPMKGLDKAVWWIEYVLRHKGAQHLVSPSRDMPYWKYYCLDVIGFIFIATGLFLYALNAIMRKLLRYFISVLYVKEKQN